MNETEIKTFDEFSLDEKKKMLFLQQKKILQEFLKRNAISKAQFDKSFWDLILKMGFDENGNKVCVGE